MVRFPIVSHVFHIAIDTRLVTFRTFLREEGGVAFLVIIMTFVFVNKFPCAKETGT